MWDELLLHEATDDILTVGTDGGNDTQTNASGLTLGHAYTVLGTKKLSTGQRLVQIRNPWGGGEKWVGDWSDSSSKWTDELKKEVNLEVKSDGIFWISIEDYTSMFGDTQIAFDPTDMYHDYFLRLDDDGSKSSTCT